MKVLTILHVRIRFVSVEKFMIQQTSRLKILSVIIEDNSDQAEGIQDLNVKLVRQWNK